MGTLSVDKILKTSTGAAAFTLPATDGTAGQAWISDGSGQLSVGEVTAAGIATDAVGTSEIAANAVDTSEIAANAVTPAQMANSAFTANRNILINGAMQIAQRATSVVSVDSTPAYCVDRMRCYERGAGAATWSQTTTVPSGEGFGNSLRWDVTTVDSSLASNDLYILDQNIEGQDLQQLKKGTASAESVTVSFWVRSTKTGTYIHQLVDEDNNRHICKAYTISVADTWEYKTLTFAGDTTGALDNNNTGSLRFRWYLAAGTDYTSGTLATSWATQTTANRAVGQVNFFDSTSNDFYITGMQVELGITATPYEHKRFGQELAACQRYFNKTFNYATAVANGAGHTWAGALGWDTRITTQSANVNWQYPVAMRALPTGTLYNTRTGGAAGQWTTGGSDSANARFLTTSETTCFIDNTGTTLGAASWGIWATADAEI